MTEAKIINDDPIGRFKAGEIGIILENDYDSKYDYKVELPGIRAEKAVPPFLREGDVISRVYYFYKNEIEII
jgi:hypothetical protein